MQPRAARTPARNRLRHSRFCGIIFATTRKEEQAMAKERLVVIGGDAAGMSAAAQAKRLDKGLEVIAFEKGPHTSYSA